MRVRHLFCLPRTILTDFKNATLDNFLCIYLTNKFTMVYYKLNWTLFSNFEHDFIHNDVTAEMIVDVGCIKNVILTTKYRVWLPLAVITARRRLVIDWQTFLMVLWGIFRHSSNNTVLNSSGFRGWGWRLRTRLPSSSHKCSIGFKSGDIAGQSMTLIAFVWRKFCVNLAVCARALSCWNVNPFCWLFCCINGTKTRWRISSTYLLAVRVPSKTISCDRKLWLIAPQTITPPPPNLSRSRTQSSAKRSHKRDFCRLYCLR